MFPDKIAWPSSFSLPAAVLLAALSIQPADADNTTCASKQLDWYSSVVGESPCVTYQRLRQICNNDYQVSTFPKGAVPGDQCQDQVSACCCNTIAFQLSMLCLNCQQDAQGGDVTGFDAAQGTFGVYTASCAPAENHTLPDDIQHAVCNENIRLDNYLYGGWDDGSWYYVYSKENAERDHAANNNNTFTHCSNQISPSSTPTSTAVAVATNPTSSTSKAGSPISTFSPDKPTQTSNAESGSSGRSKSTSRGALIGGVIGGVLGATLIVLAVIIWMRTRRRTVGAKGSQWTQNPCFGYAFSETQASAPAPKSLLVPSKFNTARPLLSRFSDSSFCPSGTNTPTAPGTRSNPHNAFTGRPPLSLAETSLQYHGRDSLYRLSRSNSGIFSDTYNAFEDRDRATGRARPHSGTAASVSLSAFDFMGSQVQDDGRTTRSFPLSTTTDETFASRGHRPDGTRAPTNLNAQKIGVLESRDNPYRS